MYEKFILIVTLFILNDKTTAENLEGNELNITTAENREGNELNIEELEKQKNDLYKQINEAIDDTVSNLKQNNDSDALLALNHMTELKKQIRMMNGTEFNETSPPDEIFEGSQSETDTKKQNETDIRRHSVTRANELISERNKRIKVTLEEIMALLKRKGDKTYNKEKFEEYRQKVQERLELWILERQKEKALKNATKYKLKKYKQLEKCYNEGLGKAKKSDKTKRHVYPCCRKCCKRSYMGCL